MNPTYHGISDQSNSLDPTVNERMYDFVPGGQDTKKGEELEKPAPPPGRRTTTNVIYEPSSGTLHPQTMSRSGYSNGEVEPEMDYEEATSSCLRICLLSILVVVSLFLAIVAVVLVLLLWFGVTNPQECPTTTAPVVMTSSVGSGTAASSTGSSCSCEGMRFRKERKIVF